MTYHWIITIQFGNNGQTTGHGTFTPSDGMSRKDAYDQLYNHVITNAGHPEGGAVLFFSLEPNEL